MAERITVYVDAERHRRFKAAAAGLGLTLTEFMVRAADQVLTVPERERAARQMDQVRAAFSEPLADGDMRRMREEGRRF